MTAGPVAPDGQRSSELRSGAPDEDASRTWCRAEDVLWSLVLAAATLGLGITVALQRIEFGSTAGGWVFRYVSPLAPRIVAIAFAAGVASTIVYEAGRRRVVARPRLVVPAVLAGGIVAQLGLHALSPHTLAELLVSDVATGFHGAAARSNPIEVLTDFERAIGQLPMHARVNMPGKILLFHALGALTPDPRLQAVAIVVLSSLAGLVLYAVVVRACGDRRMALDAMALWLLVPSKIAFYPLPNVVSPLPAMVAVWCVGRALESRAIAWAVAAGVAAYATALFDPLALWIGVAFTPILADAVASRGVRVRTVVALIAIVLAALAACHLVMLGTTGFDVVARLVAMTGIVREFNVRWARPRDVWIAANLKDVVLALGPAVSVALVAAVVAALARIGRALRAGEPRRAWAPGPTLAVAAFVVVGVLDAICLNRGEVARLWIVVYLPVQVAVAWWASGRSLTRGTIVGSTVAWTAITVATVGYCIP